MTQHRELATAIRCAVFDKIESDGMLVSSGVEQAIEDALILHAAKGDRAESGPEVEEYIKFLERHFAPPNVIDAAKRFFRTGVR